MNAENLVIVATSSQAEKFFQDVNVIANFIRAGRFRNLLQTTKQLPEPWEPPE